MIGLNNYCLVGFICALWVSSANGHGRLVDPPARATMWRLGFNTPVHYNDHQLFCGGYARQWTRNHGRCGECGDPWDIPRPRPNEAGGLWGTGVISKVYRQREIATVTVHLTANHMGWFEFRLCPNDNPKQYVKQSCLNKHVLKLVDYPGTRYQLKHSETGLFMIRLQLPENVICSQCVIQWHYTTGNNWGFCKDGTNQPGCGPQEVFRGCSDVAIFAQDDPTYFQFLNLTRESDLSQFLHLKETPELQPETEEGVVPVIIPDVTEPPQSNDVDLVDAVDPDFQKVKDVKSHNNRFISAINGPSRLTTSKRPSIVFLDEEQPVSKGKDNSLFRFTQAFNREEPKSVSPAAGKKYVSSDDFRKNLHLDKGNRISAPTPFLPERQRQGDPQPFVINPYSLGVTPSPLGPPLVFPPPEISQPFITGGLHSIHSNQPPENYNPVLEDGISTAVLGPAATPPTIIVPTQDTLSGIQGIPMSTLQVLRSLTGLGGNQPSVSSGLPLTALQAPSTNLPNDEAMQRIMLLQQALGLTSSSSSNQDSPIVLILV